MPLPAIPLPCVPTRGQPHGAEAGTEPWSAIGHLPLVRIIPGQPHAGRNVPQKKTGALTVFDAVSGIQAEGLSNMRISEKLATQYYHTMFSVVLIGATAQAADTFVSLDLPGAKATRAVGIDADGAAVGDLTGVPFP